MFFIPIANIIFAIKLTHQISVRFGKGGGFTAGLIFLPIVFWPILGFGSAQYEDSINHGDSICLIYKCKIKTLEKSRVFLFKKWLMK